MNRKNYEVAFNQLNKEQRKVVTTIEGPVMVIAGPGSGKTQLLSIRVGYILQNTDAQPENILCLTYTDSAVNTMRERLVEFIGTEAYKINIQTYHSFGAKIIQNYPFYFQKYLAFEPASDIKLMSIINDIQETLPYSSTLKNTRQLIKIKDLIINLKNNLVRPNELQEIIRTDLKFISQINPFLQENSAILSRISSKVIPVFESLKTISEKLIKQIKFESMTVDGLSIYWLNDLKMAINEFYETHKTKSLTIFKNKWLAKDNNNNFIIKWLEKYQQLDELADFYQNYLDELNKRELIDYPDMILEVLSALKNNDDLRYSLQEKYQYIMIDEFQDSNEAQNYLVKLLGDNPVNESKPNIMIVGDDDQAIFAFQGANYSHMLNFYQNYQNVCLVSLKNNYRSSPAIIDFYQKISSQISDRITNNLPSIEKKFKASGQNYNYLSNIKRIDFMTSINQLDWIAKYCQERSNSLSDIAIIAPRHRYLEELIPHLKSHNLSTNYERRNNILSDPLINQLIVICQLIVSLSNKSDKLTSDSLWGEVLSAPFWQIDIKLLWDISQIAYQKSLSWTDIILNDQTLQPIGYFIVSLSQQIDFYTAEEIIDFIIGRESYLPTNFISPFYDYYFKDLSTLNNYQELLSNLIVLRHSFSDYQKSSHQTMKLYDFINFIELHQSLNQIILNNSLNFENNNAINLITAHKSKGQEFETVIIFNTNEDTWGESSRNSRNTNFSLPPTLEFINYQSESINEKIRLFYVAISRAKKNVILLNYRFKSDNRRSLPLSFLNETKNEDQSISPYLPINSQSIELIDQKPSLNKLSDVTDTWQNRHIRSLQQETFQKYIQKKLETFQLSPTNFNSFLDVVNAGPTFFFVEHILHFPKAQSAQTAYGNAMHAVLQWLDNTMKINPDFNNTSEIEHQFILKLKKQRLSDNNFELLKERGQKSLETFFNQKRDILLSNGLSEFSLKDQGIFIKSAHLTGKIDKIIINEKQKTLDIIDYKTSRPFSNWNKDNYSYNYQKQLYFYYILIKKSDRFKNYKINSCLNIFVDPIDNKTIKELGLNFDPNELSKIEQLIPIVWESINNLSFPDISSYHKDIYGIKAFENDLLNKITAL